MDPVERRKRYVRQVALACTVLMFAVTTLSAFVRLAGAAASDLPAEFVESGAVVAARAAHRVAASTVLVFVIGLLALSLGPRPFLQREGRHALALFVLVALLAVLGRWSAGTVGPAVTLGNLLGGFLVFALCWRLALREPQPLAPRFHHLAALAAGVLVVEVSLFALVVAPGLPLGVALAHNVIVMLLLAALLRVLRLPWLG